MPSPMTSELKRLRQLATGRLRPEEVKHLNGVLDDPARFDELATSLTLDAGSLLDSLRRLPTGTNPDADRLVGRLLQRIDEVSSADAGYDNTQSIPPAERKPLRQAERTQLAPAARLPAEGELWQLDAFKIRKILGRGGMGTVYLADDERLGRQVAIKTLNRDLAMQPGAIERFLREARTAARVEHDHICPIYQVGEERGIPFIAMPLLKGEPLNERIKREQRISVSEALRIGREIALGLAAAHEAGLIHRDIKPGNIWLENTRGRSNRVRILDFGLARGNADENDLSAAGLVLGTPAYMAPEQARGKKVDGRADLWSLGVILYEMVVGQRPFTGTDSMAVLTSLAVDQPTPPLEPNPAVSPEFSRLIMLLLSKNPDDRPASAQDVAERLSQIQIESTFPMIEELPGAAAPLASPVTPESAFAHLDDDPTELTPPVSTKKTAITKTVVTRQSEIKAALARKSRKKSVRPVWWVGAALLLLVTGAGGVLITKGKAGAPSKTEVAEAPKEAPKKEPRASTVKTPTPPAAKPAEPDLRDPDRRAAEYVMSVGGYVQIENEINPRFYIGELPKGPFQLREVALFDQPRMTDAGLAAFKGCTRLASLSLHGDQLTDAALAHFKDCKNLIHLFIGGKSFSDRGLEHFKDCKKIESVTLRIPRLTDEGLQNFVEGKEFRSFGLVETPNLTQRGLAVLKNQNRLQSLSLMSMDNLTDEGLGVFSDCREFDMIQIDNCKNITDAGLAAFKNCKRVRHLSLSNMSIGDPGVALFANVQGLSDVRLFNLPNVGDAGLKSLGQIPSLTHLEVSRTAVTEAMIEKWHEARPNVKLRWNGETIGATPDRRTAERTLARGGSVRINNGHDEIAMPHLLPEKEFQLTGIRFNTGNLLANDDLLVHAAQCKDLRHLSVWKSAVTDAGLARFRGATKLFEIHFEDTAVTDAGFANFSECKQLITLGAARTKITDAGLKAFKGNTNFLVINLEDTNVGTAGLSQFGECKFLQCLALTGTRTTDEDLDLFRESKNLNQLLLGRTNVTDACVPKILRFKNLAELRLYGTKISPAKIAELQKALPNCTIVLTEPK